MQWNNYNKTIIQSQIRNNMIYYEYTIKTSNTNNVWCNSPQNEELALASIDAFSKLGELAEQDYILFHTLSKNNKPGKNKNPDIQRVANQKMMQPHWNKIWRTRTNMLAKKSFDDEPLWDGEWSQTPARFALGMIQKYIRIIKDQETPSLEMLQLQNNFVKFISDELKKELEQIDDTWGKYNSNNILDGTCKKVIGKNKTIRVVCGVERILNTINDLQVDYVDKNATPVNDKLAPIFA